MKKLFIISNESIYSENNNYFCDNIDLKTLPEGLNKNFQVNLIGRKSKINRAFKIDLRDIKIFDNIAIVIIIIFHNVFINIPGSHINHPIS